MVRLKKEWKVFWIRTGLTFVFTPILYLIGSVFFYLTKGREIDLTMFSNLDALLMFSVLFAVVVNLIIHYKKKLFLNS